MAAEIYKPTEELVARVKKTVDKVKQSFRRHTIRDSSRGSVYISNHATKRMNERDIPRNILELAVQYGHKISTHKYLLKYKDIPGCVLDAMGHAERSEIDSILPVCIIMQNASAHAGAFDSNSRYVMKTCYRIGDGCDAQRPGHSVAWNDRRNTYKANRSLRDALYRMTCCAPCIVFKSNKAFGRFVDRAINFSKKYVKS